MKNIKLRSLFKIVTIIGYLLSIYLTSDNFTFPKLFLLTIVFGFIYIHFIFNIKKMYDFIYRKRYIIGIILFLIGVALKLHGSSIGNWNSFIQPNYHLKNNGTVIGINRSIRSDEWMVSSMSLLSQAKNNFSNNNGMIMAWDQPVSLFPSLPSFNISIIGNILSLPFLFLPVEYAFSFFWLACLFIMFFSTFELSMLVTKKNKLYSLLGAVLITLSPASMWWSIIKMLVYGPIVILLFNALLKEKKVYKKIVFSILIALFGINYIMLMYPAWQISFGYVYLGFIIWIMIENKEKLNWKMLFYLLFIIILIGAVMVPIYMDSIDIYTLMSNTVYPGARMSTGGSHWDLLFNYMGTIFYPLTAAVNASELSNFIGFYPLPIIFAVHLILKLKKANKDWFLIIFSIIAILLSLWNYIKLPSFLAKISLLYLSTPQRTQIVVGLICIFLLLRRMSLYENSNKLSREQYLKLGLLSMLIAAITVSITIYSVGTFITLVKAIIMLLVFTPFIFLIILNNKKTNKYLATALIVLSLYAGGTVNPINSGLSEVYDKPLSKEIQEISSLQKDSRWITMYDKPSISNYLIANGAKTINSTNYYPNLDLWKKLDLNNKYDYVYNRYAHVYILFTEKETEFVLLGNDCIELKINIDDLKKIDVNYIVTERNLEYHSSESTILKCVYEEYGFYIYRVIYK